MSRPRLCFTVISDALKGQQFSFDGDQPITIGRTAENLLALEHKSVSRRHARVEANGGETVLVDLGSHNGTRVGDQLVSRHVLRPGDVIGLGEILLEFAPLEPEAAAEGPSALPAVVPAAAQGAALARPLTFDEIYAQAAPTPTTPAAPVRRRAYWPLIYGLLLATVVMVGLVAFWRVGQRTPGEPTIGVKLRVGDVQPVNLAWIPGPDEQGIVRGLDRVDEIGLPTDPRVADARKTKFKTFVAVQGKSLGTADISVVGTPLGRVRLRVLVRGVKPESEGDVWMRKPVSERRAYGHKLIERAKLFQRRSGEVDSQTWKVIHDLSLASRLLESFPDESHRAADAAKTARELRLALAERFDKLARRIDVLFTQGRLPECLAAARELVSLFQDPETEEYYIVNAYYEGLLEEVAAADREAQEKR